MPTRVRALQTYVTRATRRRALESTRARSHMPRAYRSLHRRPAPARVALSSASSLYVATRQPTAVRIRPSRLAAGGRSASAGEAVGLTGTHDAPRACHGSQRTRETVSRPQARYAAASTPRTSWSTNFFEHRDHGDKRHLRAAALVLRAVHA